jgi:hypothetical protein
MKFYMLVPILFLAACAAGHNPMLHTDPVCLDLNLHMTPGFFTGFWHGVICPFTFIASLFTDDVSVYSVCNTGGWYDFGFVFGAGILGGSSTASRRKKNHEQGR